MLKHYQHTLLCFLLAGLLGLAAAKAIFRHAADSPDAVTLSVTNPGSAP